MMSPQFTRPAACFDEARLQDFAQNQRNFDMQRNATVGSAVPLKPARERNKVVLARMLERVTDNPACEVDHDLLRLCQMAARGL